jgi:hypothetical protein
MQSYASHPLYRTWVNMLGRCYDEDILGFSSYGRRGIRVCRRWQGNGGLDNFIADMGPQPSNEHTLERVNTYGDYEKENCTWATMQEQSENHVPYASLVPYYTDDAITKLRNNHRAYYSNRYRTNADHRERVQASQKAYRARVLAGQTVRTRWQRRENPNGYYGVSRYQDGYTSRFAMRHLGNTKTAIAAAFIYDEAIRRSGSTLHPVNNVRREDAQQAELAALHGAEITNTVAYRTLGIYSEPSAEGLPC